MYSTRSLMPTAMLHTLHRSRRSVYHMTEKDPFSTNLQPFSSEYAGEYCSLGDATETQ
ncbi:hypothetical protein [Calothrix sp. 336/3]|uniref:hypothetical protein n=1 Tax=Calothrix sp. 336/3 TaxID=1337936 RepID=UPI00143A8486|nr:hypothetical protein [Calothrix sp. 336/3]